MLRPEGGATVGQNVRRDEVEGGGQSVVRSTYCTGYASRRMWLTFAREKCRRYLAKNVDYFVLPTLEEQGDFTNPRHDVKSAVRGGALGAVDDTVELEPVPEEDDC